MRRPPDPRPLTKRERGQANIGRALKGRKERWGKPEPETGKPGQPQLINTMGSGPLSGPALHNRWQHSINAGPGRQPRLVASWSAPFGARPLLAAERGLVGRKIGRANGRSPLPTTPKTPSHEFQISNSRAINNITLPSPSDSPRRCYPGPVRAPAFRERQTGAPRPGCKSSPWPPSVSRSTDRVTQDNGIDPKPFWRLRATPTGRTSSSRPG